MASSVKNFEWLDALYLLTRALAAPDGGRVAPLGPNGNQHDSCILRLTEAQPLRLTAIIGDARSVNNGKCVEWVEMAKGDEEEPS
jgi:hypothetical protein